MELKWKTKSFWCEISNSALKRTWVLQHQHLKNKWKCNSLIFYFIFCFLWSMCSGEISLWYTEKSNFKLKVSTRAIQMFIKSSAKDLNFWEDYKPIKVWLWIVYKIAKTNCRLLLFAKFIQSQNDYPISFEYSYLKTTCLINQNFA